MYIIDLKRPKLRVRQAQLLAVRQRGERGAQRLDL